MNKEARTLLETSVDQDLDLYKCIIKNFICKNRRNPYVYECLMLLFYILLVNISCVWNILCTFAP